MSEMKKFRYNHWRVAVLRRLEISGKVYRVGYDMGGDGDVLSENRQGIVVKWPAYRYSELDSEKSFFKTQKYAPASTVFYLKLNEDESLEDDGEIETVEIIDFENRRKRPKV